MRVLLIDNEDSFTWNLWQLIRGLGAECDVRSKHDITLRQIKKMKPNRIVISAGPGHPRDAKLSNAILRNFQFPAPRSLRGEVGSIFNFQFPILGVCLGHQCIAHIFGGPSFIGHAPEVRHGKTSSVFHTGTGIFSGIPSPFRAARYHSLIVRRLPGNFELLCWTPSLPTPLPPIRQAQGKLGEGRKNQSRRSMIIMGMRHKTLPIVGVQFHPESFMTEHGGRIMKNFLQDQW